MEGVEERKGVGATGYAYDQGLYALGEAVVKDERADARFQGTDGFLVSGDSESLLGTRLLQLRKVAPIVEGLEGGLTVSEVHLADGCKILPNALEVAQVHPQRLDKDALNGKVVADGGDSDVFIMTFANPQDGFPGALLQADD